MSDVPAYQDDLYTDEAFRRPTSGTGTCGSRVRWYGVDAEEWLHG